MSRGRETAEILRTTRTVETIVLFLGNVTIDPASEVEVVLETPDGRAHKVRVNPGWFIPSIDGPSIY